MPPEVTFNVNDGDNLKVLEKYFNQHIIAHSEARQILEVLTEEEVPSLFKDPLGWVWNNTINAIREEVSKSKEIGGFFGTIIGIKDRMTCDFGLSKALLGEGKDNMIGTLIASLWTFAVALGIWKIIPEGGTGGTVAKYLIGVAMLTTLLSFWIPFAAQISEIGI
jgi:hypothetical protein